MRITNVMTVTAGRKVTPTMPANDPHVTAAQKTRAAWLRYRDAFDAFTRRPSLETARANLAAWAAFVRTVLTDPVDIKVNVDKRRRHLAAILGCDPSLIREEG